MALLVEALEMLSILVRRASSRTRTERISYDK